MKSTPGVANARLKPSQSCSPSVAMALHLRQNAILLSSLARQAAGALVACEPGATALASAAQQDWSSQTRHDASLQQQQHETASTSQSGWPCTTHAAAGRGWQGMRAYNTWRYPKRVFDMPPEIKAIVERREAEKQSVPEYAPPPPQPKDMSLTSKRVGCIAVKAGMTQEWDEHGTKVPLTVLFVDDCQVVGIKSPERNGYWALQVGAGYRKLKSLDPTMAGFYLKQGVPFKHDMVEFKVSEDAVLPVGTHITAAHFVAGQHVDVQGVTKDKGFQGVMKRWGFKGQPASHGVSLAHRAPGSIGNRKDPGRVWKGKKLPGHMGDEWRTVLNCLVYKVDPQRNLVYVRGQVPGPAGKFVYLRDAICVPRERKADWGLPFPTFLGDPATLPVTVFKFPRDPYRPFVEEADYFPIEWKKGE